MAGQPKDVRRARQLNTEATRADSTTFNSRYKNLQVWTTIIRKGLNGPEREDVVIMFANGSFSTTDPDVIEALKTNPMYGGSSHDNPPFTSKSGKQPVYWHDGFPDWYLVEMKKRQQELSRTEGTHEVKAALPKE